MKNRYNILVCINKKCKDLLITMLKSLLSNNDAIINLYCVHSELESEDIEYVSKCNEVKDVNYHFLKIDKSEFKTFPTVKRYPAEIYYRLFAHEMLPESLERILYLDVDIIVKGSINELYNTEFNGNMIIATTHIGGLMNFVNKVRLGAFGKNLVYANSGVMLFNLPLMRKTVKKEDIVSFIRRKKPFMTLYDQDVIFALYGNMIGLVSSKIYNLSDREIKQHNLFSKIKINEDWVEKNNVIIHYIGKNKPWKPNYKGILGKYYFIYK